MDVPRQMGQLLEAENARLHERLEQLKRALANARGEGDAEALQLELELAHLRAQISQRNRALFGPYSERRESSESAQPEPPPRKRPTPRKPAQLPMVGVVHTLDEAEQSCTECGGALQEMKGQFETADEVTVVKHGASRPPRRCCPVSRTGSRAMASRSMRACARRPSERRSCSNSRIAGATVSANTSLRKRIAPSLPR